MFDAFYKKSILFFVLIVLVGINFALFGFNQALPSGDASNYYDYGRNIALGNGYTLDGKTFSALREPGYPFFVAAIFKIFGIGNLTAVKIIQVLLLAAAAYFICLCFELYGEKTKGLLAALATVLIPSFGYYSNLIMPEILFLFYLVLSLYILLGIFKKPAGSGPYLVLGILFGVITLTRSHLFFFPIMLGILLLSVFKNPKNIFILYLSFFFLISSWVGYIYYKTGEFAITQGRMELHLFVRAERSKLSYSELADYGIAWVKRSLSGGASYDILDNYEIKGLKKNYQDELAKGVPFGAIRKRSVEIIFQNWGHYLFGNFIEVIKLLFVEHLFPPVSNLLNRAVRLGIYLAVYGVFILGIVKYLLNRPRHLRQFLGVLGFFVLYHLVLLSFFDPVPRFNTPYLVFYLMIGIVGLANNSQFIHSYGNRAK